MRKLKFELEMGKGRVGNPHELENIHELGEATLSTSPECHGTLVKLRGEHPSRYLCHTGHGFTAECLLDELNEVTEDATWNAIRSMQETAMLLAHVAEHWRSVDPKVADTFEQQARQAHTRARSVRRLATEQGAGEPELVEKTR